VNLVFIGPTVNRQFAEAISQILSLRGDKLTVVLQGQKHTANRSGKHVWVIRASSKPRAWCKRNVPASETSERWRDARFPCDELLVHPDVCQQAMAEILSVLKTSRRWHLHPSVDDDFKSWELENRRRTVALAKSRRRIKALRRISAFSDLDVVALKNQLEEVRATFGVWNREWDEEGDSIEASRNLHNSEPAQAYRRTPDSVPTDVEPQEIRTKSIRVCTETLLARRSLIRRWLRIKWLEQWLRQLPPDAMELLSQPFPNRRWHLLNLWLRVPESRDLLRDIPSLAFAMASANAFHAKPVKRPLRSMRTLVRGSRKRLLAWLGFPATPLCLRLLRLVRPEDVSMELLFDLRRLMQTSPSHVVELTSLGRSLDRWTVGLVTLPILPTLQLLRAILATDREEQSLWRDSVWMARNLPDAGESLERLPRLKSLRNLQQVHDQLLVHHRIQNQQIPPAIAGRFPLTPPNPGIPGITPLSGLQEVINESIRMNHCLDTFITPMAFGTYFAYAIHYKGEHATLGLRKEGARWDIDQLKGPGNKQVSLRMRDFVTAWLSQAC